jgi:uncharacterized protein (DUF952 family)
MNTIFHITQRQQWESTKNIGTYRGPTLDTEGFIHCSTLAQLIKSANRFFANQKDLVIIIIDCDRVKPEIRYEGETINNLFPHIYGALNMEAVVQGIDFACEEDGLFRLPSELAN